MSNWWHSRKGLSPLARQVPKREARVIPSTTYIEGFKLVVLKGNRETSTLRLGTVYLLSLIGAPV